METRKLIKFGNSSHVLALPHKWLKEHKLNKGDMVYVSRNGNDELVIQPERKEIKREEKEAVVNIDNKDLRRIKREIVSAYIDNCDTIKIIGKEIKDKAGWITKIIQSLMALEIINHDSKRIVAKDFLDIKETSLKEFTHRMDIITRSMFEDVKLMLEKKEDHTESLLRRDFDIDKLLFVIVKIERFIINNPSIAYRLKYTPKDARFAEIICRHIEVLADKLKNVVKYFDELSNKSKKFLLELIIETEKNYLDIMKAINKNDIEIGYKLSSKKQELVDKCADLYEKHWNWKGFPMVLNYIKEMTILIHNIGRVLYT